jgi:hypothetical protein
LIRNVKMNFYEFYNCERNELIVRAAVSL